MKNLPLLVGTLLGSILLIGGIAYFFSTPGASTTSGGSISQEMLLEGGRYTKGAEEPVVTIVEFSDFECPACEQARPFIDQVLSAYPEQVSLMYRHFPLDSIHLNARLAAIASEVAGEEGKFWEYHDLLFDNQTSWSSITDRTELKNTLATYAAELEIDKDTFLARIEATNVAEIVQSDVSVATRASVNATPTFFVNGQKVSAPELLSTLGSLLAEEATESGSSEESN